MFVYPVLAVAAVTATTLLTAAVSLRIVLRGRSDATVRDAASALATVLVSVRRRRKP
jgi:hypothetical protein